MHCLDHRSFGSFKSQGSLHKHKKEFLLHQSCRVWPAEDGDGAAGYGRVSSHLRPDRHAFRECARWCAREAVLLGDAGEGMVAWFYHQSIFFISQSLPLPPLFLYTHSLAPHPPHSHSGVWTSYGQIPRALYLKQMNMMYYCIQISNYNSSIGQRWRKTSFAGRTISR